MAIHNPSLQEQAEDKRVTLQPTAVKQFICPGEKLPISRSIHYARLAAFYPACRECPHRNETGNLPAKTIEDLEETQKRIGRTDLFTTEGIRGVYLNEIDRQQTERIVSAFCALVLENYPRRYRFSQEKSSRELSSPLMIVGYDSRASSFELMPTVIESLRRMGMMVTEVGLSSRSSFCFAAKHLEATAGILITGSGCGPAWTGFDFVGESAFPYSLGGQLDKLKFRLQKKFSRPSRQGGKLNSFQAAIPYRTNLWKYFQHLKPLEIVCHKSDPFTTQTLLELFAKLPCHLTLIDMPGKQSLTTKREVAERATIADFVVKSGADLGVMIEEDGMTCHFLDEQARIVSALSIVRLFLANPALSKAGSSIVLTDRLRNEIQKERLPSEIEIIPTLTNREAISKTIREHGVSFGCEEAGRYWFGETHPVCDSILTLGVVLQILSHTEKPFSVSIEGISG